VVLRLVRNAMSKTCKGQECTEKCTRGDKSEKVSIVATPDAIVQPNAMVIECFDTIIADSAVIASRRSPDIAGLAEFDRYVHSRSL
jgi:hypothetical protein